MQSTYSSFLMRRRHTKPCRFFQEGGCRKSAEECPFAHVYIRPISDAHQRPRPCKYFIAGYCDMGQRCRFLHGNEPLDRFHTPPARPIELFQPRSNGTASPIIPSRIVTSGYQSDTSAPSESYPPSEPSIATSDDVFIETASHPDSDTDRTCLVRPGPRLGYDMTTPMMKSFREKRRLANERRRAAKYKTKPCKFFNTPEGCPSGDLCTFIHAKPSLSPVDTSPTPTGPLDVPTKPTTPTSGSKPPHGPWRVISGGVTFGAKLPARKHTICRTPPPVMDSAENTERPPTPVLSPQPVRPSVLKIRTMAVPERPISAPPSTARPLSKEGRSMFAAEA